jgi:hypothetical protein
MADVLGKYSFLDTPDVNGVLVLLVGDATQTINGTTNQVSVTGSNPTITVGLSDNPVLPGTESLTLPSGTTAQQPGSPVAGMVRFNTTLGSTEYYNGTAWIPAGNIIQTVVGNVAAVSSNSQIPFDNTVPLSTEGVQIWTQSFTPILTNSTILITTSGFCTVASSADIWVTGAAFNGTTCFSASLVAFTTTTNEGRGFSLISTQTSGSTAARTYSVRMGPNTAVTMYVNTGTSTQNYGGTVNIGKYIIQEIAP